MFNHLLQSLFSDNKLSVGQALGADNLAAGGTASRSVSQLTFQSLDLLSDLTTTSGSRARSDNELLGGVMMMVVRVPAGGSGGCGESRWRNVSDDSLLSIFEGSWLRRRRRARLVENRRWSRLSHRRRHHLDRRWRHWSLLGGRHHLNGWRRSWSCDWNSSRRCLGWRSLNWGSGRRGSLGWRWLRSWLSDLLLGRRRRQSSSRCFWFPRGGNFSFDLLVILADLEKLVDVILAESLLHNDCVALFEEWISEINESSLRNKLSRNASLALLRVLALHCSATAAARGAA